jgi:DNA-binding SARP family transcriptional activator
VRVRQLLGLLVLRPSVTRETAMALLWPDASPERARNNLRVTLTHLRSLLEPDRRGGEAAFHLRQRGETLALHRSAALDVDVWAVEDHAAAARTFDARGHHAEAAEHHLAAAERWRGELLTDLRGLPDLAGELHALDDAAAESTARAGEWLLATGAAPRARLLAERLLRHDPYSERAYRLLLGAALARGDRTAAAEAWERCHAHLADLGVDPAPETQMLANRLAGL